jgi:hypothetical protein
VAKYEGLTAAKAWLDTTSLQQRIRLATWDFRYGDLLRDMPAKGIYVPRSGDRDFSWGFFKQVKGWLYSAAYKRMQDRQARLGALARRKVFVSYAHEDSNWLNKLQVHLKPLVTDGLLDVWDDTRLRPGARWRDEIERALGMARAAILLVSPDFLASDFVRTSELPPLLEKAESGGAQILSVIVRPCLFKEHRELSKYQAVNDPDRPLSGLSAHDVESTFLQLARHVLELINPGETGDTGGEHRSLGKRAPRRRAE